MFDCLWLVLSVVSFYYKTWGAIRTLSGSLMVRTNLINAGYCSVSQLEDDLTQLDTDVNISVCLHLPRKCQCDVLGVCKKKYALNMMGGI